MTLFQAYGYAKSALEDAGILEYAFEARQLLRFVTGYTNAQILQSYQSDLTETQEALFFDLVRRRHERYPLQYLLGSWSFYGLDFAVGEGVLIPRPDSEFLVEAAIDWLKTRENAKVIDLCAGSGCIGIAIARRTPDADVTLLEKSERALRYLRKNVSALAPDVRVLAADLTDVPEENFDLVTCNPPYIPTAQLAGLMREVRFEPTEALDGGEDGLAFYRLLCRVWTKKLNPGGQLLVEVGQGQADDVAALFREAGLQNIVTRKDYNRIPRVVSGDKAADR